MAKKKESWEIFLNTKKDLVIRGTKDPRRKNAYLLTFESKLAKKDTANVLDICSQIIGKENVKSSKEFAVLFEVQGNKKQKK